MRELILKCAAENAKALEQAILTAVATENWDHASECSITLKGIRQFTDVLLSKLKEDDDG